ncbi:MAG: hypothetical protein WCA07_06330 [Gloeobacterales cyanobacterium]
MAQQVQASPLDDLAKTLQKALPDYVNRAYGSIPGTSRLLGTSVPQVAGTEIRFLTFERFWDRTQMKPVLIERVLRIERLQNRWVLVSVKARFGPVPETVKDIGPYFSQLEKPYQGEPLDVTIRALPPTDTSVGAFAAGVRTFLRDYDLGLVHKF